MIFTHGHHRKYAVGFAIWCCHLITVAAMPQVLMKMGNYSFNAEDFEYVYQKNLKAGKQTPDECLALYIPYKLKIAAAIDAGLDTLPAIINQWKHYRNLPSASPTTCEMDAELLDGLLLYAITDSVVWSKAALDSTGLKAFYKKNARNFRWEKRMKATAFYCSDPKIAGRVRTAVNNTNESHVRLPDGLFTFFCSAGGVSPCVDTAFMILPKGANTLADRVKWRKGCSKLLEWNGKSVFLNVHAILSPCSKTFEEARGQVLAAYQDELERKWVEELKRQYPVIIDENVWTNLKKKYEE